MAVAIYLTDVGDCLTKKLAFSPPQYGEGKAYRPKGRQARGEVLFSAFYFPEEKAAEGNALCYPPEKSIFKGECKHGNR